MDRRPKIWLKACQKILILGTEDQCIGTGLIIAGVHDDALLKLETCCSHSEKQL